ncbi:epoxyqueuosine reductase [Caulobacter ginsengisoli]|uniref:Epoxyqueuosine reductase n=1 Tax=Caulobacter ginsengisoli TaxID=400775 RepID=A0ABU0IVP5_9CAUL|nr:tRNA epoxyqueuosine(34) reductase QueG [Caulobacter ginsengisoli]MDQ0465450.1 epoxyqueuosine reductase [Caulobacter ginsengisoli]
MKPALAGDGRAEIRARALGLGFDACGFASAADPWPNGDWLAQFVAEGLQGQMGWMEETLERRRHPTAMWPGAVSAVVLGINYGPEHDPLAALDQRSTGNISAYARGDDYHELIKGRLKQLAGWMVSRFGGEVKVFVDTAPLLEKPLAQRAGLGWQGKHTNLVSRELGSWLFLGSVLTSLDLPADAAEADHCGSCRACLDICPTNAFPAPYRLDARRCISYLTIEHDGPVDPALRPLMGNRIYGCDDCLAVCPWNKFAATAQEAAFHAREALDSPPLAELAVLDDAAFRALFRKSPIKRIGRDRFVRNVLYAIGNSGDASLLPAAQRLAGDPSPMVADAAQWAIGQLTQNPLIPAKAGTQAFSVLDRSNPATPGDRTASVDIPQKTPGSPLSRG